MDSPVKKHPASFRDPSGYIFMHGDQLYRQVNKVFAVPFDTFMNGGCYKALTEKKWLIPHTLVPENLTGDPRWFATIRPEPLSFISYPGEWSFDMLKDAALLTLQVLRTALEHGMILKDASAYNIQFHKGRPVFIDTLSFDLYNEKEPWVAYRQFCEHFLGPLLLMHYRKLPLHTLWQAWPDGIPLQVTRALLPWRSRLSLHTWLHIHLNAKMSGRKTTGKSIHFSKSKLLNLVMSLELLVRKLQWGHKNSNWSDYYNEAAARDIYLSEKKKLFSDWISGMQDIRNAADLGANDGFFSTMIAATGIPVVAADSDAVCINRLYRQCLATGEKNIHPLIADLGNPSPASGVNHEERMALLNRLPADLVTALALVHHLAIGKNMPWEKIAVLFSRVCKKYLVIEYVPREDGKVNEMLAGRKDVFDEYGQAFFESAFQAYFHTERKVDIGNSGRVLYLMSRHA